MEKLGTVQAFSVVTALVMLALGPVQPVKAEGMEAENSEPSIVEIEDTFNEGEQGWTGAFADFPHAVSALELYDVRFSLETLPEEINPTKQALSLNGMNRSDDLFMYVKKPVQVKPNTQYKINFDFDIATNAPPRRMGIGGAPGESVFVKAGAVPYEPEPVVRDDYYRLNADKGNQAKEGPDAINVGNLAKVASKDNSYQLKNLHNQSKPFYARSDSQGNLWLFIGTDSGFEGLTKIYISRIQATLIEQ
ncbi:hypothetical protein [Salinithrix halophila]|uniref:Uncharacterized protein n=1 Tax=Salinithrix halophila TaxID=1485204 RepID=A0ABV8JLY0_9BACL